MASRLGRRGLVAAVLVLFGAILVAAWIAGGEQPVAPIAETVVLPGTGQ